jgi:hypothetical protein
MPPLALSSYRIYWRQHGSGVWNLLAEIPVTPNPALSISHSELGNGDFDFAVSAVNMTGHESRLHSSLDASAIPFGGWYIVWFMSK